MTKVKMFCEFMLIRGKPFKGYIILFVYFEGHNFWELLLALLYDLYLLKNNLQKEENWDQWLTYGNSVKSH